MRLLCECSLAYPITHRVNAVPRGGSVPHCLHCGLFDNICSTSAPADLQECWSHLWFITQAVIFMAMQARVLGPKLRDWQQLVEDCIAKAAFSHTSSKLLTMRNTVPSASSRLVYQSQALSLPPDLQPAVQSSSNSEAGSSSEGDQPLTEQQAEPEADRQQDQQLLQAAMAETLASDTTVTEPAALLAATDEAADMQDATVPMVTSTAHPPLISRVYDAVHRYEQLIAAQQPALPSSDTSPETVTEPIRAAHPRVRLEPLQIPTVEQPGHESTGSSPVGTPFSDGGDSATAVTAETHSRWHPHSMRQGATARNQAAVAAHQARLAALHASTPSRDTKGWAKHTPHAVTPGQQSAPVGLKPALRKRSSVTDLSSSVRQQQSPRPLPPLRRFGSVTPGAASATGAAGALPLSSAQQPPAVTIAEIMQRNSSLELPSAEVPNPASRLPALHSDQLRRGASVAAPNARSMELPDSRQKPLRRGGSVASVLPLRRGSSVAAPPSRFSSGHASPQHRVSEAGSMASGTKASSVTAADLASWQERLAAISPRQSLEVSPSRYNANIPPPQTRTLPLA